MQVSVTGLNLAYGGVVAVEDLDLTIHDGESIVLLGQSGCGKTSTMRCIAGLEEPTGGRIQIGDRVVFDHASGKAVPAFKRNVGMVFQSYAVWPHKTVLENVAFPLRMKKVPRTVARAKALNVLELVGLDHLAHRGASQLSGGQMQRVALARSMAMEPSVLLLDEPLSNLDARLRDDLRVELRRIQQDRGLTSLYVTHDQQEALALADRIAIMQSGRIVQLATPQQIYGAPASASIAKFMGVTNVFGVEPGPAAALRLRGHDVVFRSTGGSVSADSSIAVRPEDVRVRADGPEAVSGSGDSVNRFSGRLGVSVYQGATVRYQVVLDGGPQLDAICLGGTEVLPQGARVRVEIDADAVKVLPDEAVTQPEKAEVAA